MPLPIICNILHINFNADVNYVIGKGESIWDHFTQNNESNIADKSSGDISTDFYHKYQNDIKIVKDIGVSTIFYIY